MSSPAVLAAPFSHFRNDKTYRQAPIYAFGAPLTVSPAYCR